MDYQDDLELNDDNCRAEEKAKESILLMKKKMLRSHDLILQYNNKLKECDRLKEDLCIAQAEANKLKQESNANLSKIIKLELQSAQYKKSQQELERRLADKDVKIAGDKCHLQQLICKVKDAEDKHSEKLMEAELEKSSLEGKVKELEKELKSLKKSHLTEVNKLEKAINRLPPKPKKGAIKFVRGTNDIGVSTIDEAESVTPGKPSTEDKSVLTNEFYHIRDNPYPIFCDKCESLTEHSVEKICKIMSSHPPLVTEMLSPIRSREPHSGKVLRSCQDPNASGSNNLNFIHNDVHRNDLNRAEFNRVDSISRNFVTPIEPMVHNVQPTSIAHSLDANVPEIENLRRKIEMLERKMKKRKKKSLDDGPSSANCCGHSRSVNCCGHGQTHPNAVPNVFTNVQSDMMTEFWNRLMKFTDERAPKNDSPQKPKKKSKIKLRRLKRGKISNTKKIKNCGSTGWDIESEDCETEKIIDNSTTETSHILRIKPSNVESSKCSPVKMQSNSSDEVTENGAQIENSSNRASPVKVPDKPKDNGKKTVSRSHSSDEITENGAQIENSSNRASPVKVPDKPKGNGKKRVSLFSNIDDVEMEVQSFKHEVMENLMETSCSELPINDLPISLNVSNSSDTETANCSQNTESAYFSQNSEVNETASLSQNADLPANSSDTSVKSSLRNNESVLNRTTDSRNSGHPKFRNQRSKKSVYANSDADLSDAQVEEQFDADWVDPSVRKRKRKRSVSPRATKPTTRSNLLGKMRALKKNSTMSVAKTSSSQRPMTRRSKLTTDSETEEYEGETRETDRASSISENETDPRIPVKKQRVAHVPKQENTSEEPENPRMRKLRQVAKQICQNTDKKSTKRQKPVTRSRTIVKESKSSLSFKQPATRETPETLPSEKLDDSSLRKLSCVSSNHESMISAPVIDDSPELRALRQEREKVSKDIVGHHPDSEKTTEISKHNPTEENNVISVNITENVSKSIETKVPESLEAPDANGSEKSGSGSRNKSKKLSGASDASSESDAPKSVEKLTIAKEPSAGSEHIADITKSVQDQSEVSSTPKETRELAVERVPPTETSENDCPAPPASSSSLDIVQITNSKIAVSPMRSPVKSIKPSVSSLSESSDETSSIISTTAILNPTDPIGASKHLSNFTKSILFAKLTDKPGTSRVYSKNVVIPARILTDSAPTGNPPTEISSRHISSHVLPALISAHPTSHVTKLKKRSPICANALLPIASSNALATGPNEIPSLTFYNSTDVADTSLASASSTASPASNLPENLATRLMESPRLTFYNCADTVVPANANATPISSNNSADTLTDESKVCVKVERDSSLPRSTEKFERSLLVYDTNLHDDLEKQFNTDIVPSLQPIVDNHDTKKKKKSTKSPSNDSTPTINVVKELRSRQVLSGPATNPNQRNRPTIKNISDDETHETPIYSRGILGPGPLLGRYMREQKNKSKIAKTRRIAAAKLQADAEKAVKTELDRLVESEEWTSELHQSVIATLREVHSMRTVAKSIVNLLVERAALGEPLDRTYTPPAPIMTKTQQRIASLINSLDRDGIMPGVSELVQNGIEYTLFRLGHAPEYEVAEGLVRILTALARIKKDRERVRILCCDSLYCLGRKAITVIFIILSVWPEVFPMHGSGVGELPNCIAHLIKMETMPKALSLKKMITGYYMYPQIQPRSSVIMSGLIQALQTNYCGDLEASILLLAKWEGTDWAYDNIINGGLLKIIGNNGYPSRFDALSLLGFILRTFPLADPLGAVQKIADQLYKMFESDEASHDLQEGVASALLSLSRLVTYFDKIAETLLKWKPNQTLRTRTIEQFKAFFKMRAATWWTQRHQLGVNMNEAAGEKNRV